MRTKFKEFLIFFSFLPLGTIAQSSKDTGGVFTISEMKEVFLNRYADSINHFGCEDIIPAFLKNSCFDYQPFYWGSFHTPVCLRELVLERVHNKEALICLLRANNDSMKVLCGKEYEMAGIMPNRKLSFYQLIEKRLTELNR